MLYLRLFHGRTNSAQEMDDWGSNGPVFGPLHYVHTTYASCIKLGSKNGTDGMLFLFDDMIYYNGVFYGDWSVFEQEAFRRGKYTITLFDQSKATIPTS